VKESGVFSLPRYGKALPLGRKDLVKFLTNLGLKPSVVQIYEQRLKKRIFIRKKKGRNQQPGVTHVEFARINELIWEVIDVAICLDPVSIFDREGKDIRILKRAIRKVYTVALFNKGLVVKYYKELSALLRHRYYCYETEEEPSLSPGNIFREFQYFSFFQSWKPDHEHFERLAPFLSTRHFIPGDAKAEKSAIEDFKSISCTPFEVDPALLLEARAIAHKLGTDLSPKIHFPYRTHISLKNAGSLDRSGSEGGRAAEIRDAVYRDLRSQYEMNQDAYGHSAGSSRYEEYEKCFLDLEYSYWLGVPARAGLDSELGTFIYQKACSSVNVWQGPIPVKVLTVSEPGYKARIVTTTKWFVNIVQQPVGHLLVDALRQVPELSSGLCRADQAWQVAESLTRRHSGAFREGTKVLSSDLTSATDAIPRSIAAALFEGFCEGIGFREKSPKVFELCSRILRSDRIVTYRDESFVTVRGIPMGEPLTKGILALFTYFAFKRSMNHFVSRHGNMVGGYFFSAGGDDHIAIGPIEFLNGITDSLTSAGAILSKTKHGVSSVAVTYCEKTLLVKNLHNRLNVHDINGLDYEKSIVVDSVKVRLMSPSSKANEVFDSTNCAIGKGKSLGRTLPWMIHRDTDIRRIALIRHWFFFRMGAKLAPKSKIYWHLLLPEWCGGLGLGLYTDYKSIADNLPMPSFVLVRQILRGDDHLLPHFSRFLSNCSVRGIARNASYTETELRAYALVSQQPSISWSERWNVCDMSHDLPERSQYMALNRQGYYLIDDAVDWLMRPIQAMKVWTEKKPWGSFDNPPLKQRYAVLWDLCEKEPAEDDPLTVDDVMQFFKYRPQRRLYCISEIEESWSFKQMPSLDVYL
jgi:hypothetical protein